MLSEVSDILGLPIRALDGEIGEVVDLLFDDRDFTVRWFVIDTGSFLPGRKVLLPPAAMENVDLGGRAIVADVTRQAVKDAPGLSTDEPVSRQHEEDLFAHYRWTPYWSVGGMTTGAAALSPVPPHATGVPDVEPAAAAGDPADAEALAGEREGDPNLRSIGEVKGYSIHASDDFVGHVTDALVESEGWVIRYLVVDTRNWLPGRHVLLSPDWVRSVGWADREVRVDLTRQQVKDAPEYAPRMAVDRDFEDRLHRHYGFAPYWI